MEDIKKAIETAKEMKEKNNFTEEQKEKICNIVFNWMIENDCHSGEQAAQNDECNVEAITLVCDLADIVGIPYDFDLD